MAGPEEKDSGALEDLARVAFEPESGIEPECHDSIVEAVLAVTRVRSHIRIPELPRDDSTHRSRSEPLDEAESDEGFTRYEIQGKLARGGMGTILKGRDLELGREVAIKVLEKRHAGNPAMVERFIEEAQIGGQLQHPGIVPVLELGFRPDRRPYFAMKLVKGRTLGTLLEARKDPNEGRRRFFDIFEKVGQTMAYAHARSVVHRDLKPANIMVGAFGEVQVMDWGLAKVLGGEGAAKREPDRSVEEVRTVVETVRSTGSDSRSHAGSVMGTPAYMPPEQARGDVQLIDERTDVFALGAILCEILTGEPPYTGETFSEVRQKAQAGNLTDALGRLDAARLDRELDRIVRTCLAQEQGDRFPNAGAVTDAFAGYLASREERARAARVNAARAEARVVAERRVRKRTVVAAVSLVTAVLLIAGGYFWMESHRRDRQRRADRNVVAALQSTTSAHEQALSAPPGDTRRWAEVMVAANRVKALAEHDDVDPALRARAEALFSRVEKDAAAAEEAAARAEKDRRMTARLDEIRTRVGDLYQFDYRKRDIDYAAAFQDYGIDLALLEDQEVARRIERSPIARHLVTALELWAYARKQVHGRDDRACRRLGRLAADLDPDPLRKRIRAAVSTDDLETLQSIARSSGVMTLPVEDVERLARAMESAGDPTGAVTLLRTAHVRHPEDFWINYFLASWYRGIRPPRLDEALCHASAAISIRPGSASAWNLLGLVLMAAGRLDEAKTAFDCALKIHPDFVHSVNNLGRTYCLAGKPERAIEIYEREIKARPENAEIHFALGLAYQDIGNLKRAFEAYRRALQLSPDLARARCNIGVLHNKLGQSEEAEAAFRQAIKTDPTLVEAHVNLANLLAHVRRIEEARELIDKAIEIDPHFGPAHDVRGLILARSGRRDEAIQAYREAIRLDPEESKHHNNLGVTYSVKGDLEAALRAFEAAIRLCPTNAGAHTNRGNILARMKRWPEALSAFRAALVHAPENPDLLIKIGQVLERLHRFEEALDHFRRGHELGSRRPDWKVDSADLVAKCKWRIELLERMDAILEGDPEPTTGRELYDLATLASFLKRHAAAARFWRSGFKIAPKMAQSANLFRAARDAARAGSGQGADAGRLDAAARAEWLRQGSVWLNRYVGALAKILEKHGESHRTQVQKSLLMVRGSRGLDGLRQARHLAVLSRDDQLRCIALWAEVERLLAECEG